MQNERATLGIGAVARRTGLSPDVLRVWERRHEAVTPQRSEGGTRLYSEAQVRRLEMLAGLVGSGHRIGRLARLDEDALAELFFAGAVRGEVTEPLARVVEDSGSPPSVLIESVCRALETVDSATVERLLTPVYLSLGARRFTLDMAIPLLREIGDRWEAGTLSVAAEHAAVAVLRTLLGGAIQRRPERDPRERAVFATPSGQRHEFGVLAAALLASGVGVDSIYLGSDVPAADVALTVERTRAGLVVVGLAPVRGDLREEFDYLASLREALPASVGIWVGGAGSIEAARALELKACGSLEEFELQIAAAADGRSELRGT
jgi:methanogenic corrinoid protein MtbC1